MFGATSLSRAERISIAVLIGVGAAALAYTVLTMYPEHVARDYTYSWRAARALLAHQNPYDVIRPSGPYPYEEYYFYPLPAALLVLPLAWLPAVPSAVAFTGLSAAALAYAVTAQGFRGLLIFLGVPYLCAAVLGQFTPLIVAAAFYPALQWAYAAKPTIAAALVAARPSVTGILLALALVAISLILIPSWPLDWLRVLSHTPHHRAPIMRPFGFILLLALLRWRTPEGRLLSVMAVAPQVFYFYDQLPVMLVAKKGWQMLVLVAASWVGWAVTWSTCTHKPMCVEFGEPWIIPLVYLPALVLVLARPQPRKSGGRDTAVDRAVEQIL